MKLTEILNQDCCIFDMKAVTKDDAIQELAQRLGNAGKLYSLENYIAAVWKREEEFSTGVGEGLAIPHGKDDSVVVPALAYGFSKSGIEYGSFDEQPVHFVFMVAVPMKSDDLHLRLLAVIARKLVHESTREKLKSAEDYEQLMSVFSDVEI